MKRVYLIEVNYRTEQWYPIAYSHAESSEKAVIKYKSGQRYNNIYGDVRTKVIS